MSGQKITSLYQICENILKAKTEVDRPETM